jgi:hypothetical protein
LLTQLVQFAMLEAELQLLPLQTLPTAVSAVVQAVFASSGRPALLAGQFW